LDFVSPTGPRPRHPCGRRESVSRRGHSRNESVLQPPGRHREAGSSAPRRQNRDAYRTPPVTPADDTRRHRRGSSWRHAKSACARLRTLILLAKPPRPVAPGGCPPTAPDCGDSKLIKEDHFCLRCHKDANPKLSAPDDRRPGTRSSRCGHRRFRRPGISWCPAPRRTPAVAELTPSRPFAQDYSVFKELAPEGGRPEGPAARRTLSSTRPSSGVGDFSPLSAASVAFTFFRSGRES